MNLKEDTLSHSGRLTVRRAARVSILVSAAALAGCGGEPVAPTPSSLIEQWGGVGFGLRCPRPRAWP